MQTIGAKIALQQSNSIDCPIPSVATIAPPSPQRPCEVVLQFFKSNASYLAYYSANPIQGSNTQIWGVFRNHLINSEL